MRAKEFRLAKRLVPSSYADITALHYEYLTQWRYVYEEPTKISKWWQIWKEEYSIGIAYGEWVDIPAIDIGKAQE
jgi:hypothetical protein